jgi:hypothetical protein
MVGNQRKIGVAGGDEGDGDDVDPEDRCEALTFEGRRGQLEIMGPGKKYRAAKSTAIDSTAGMRSQPKAA